MVSLEGREVGEPDVFGFGGYGSGYWDGESREGYVLQVGLDLSGGVCWVGHLEESSIQLCT